MDGKDAAFKAYCERFKTQYEGVEMTNRNVKIIKNTFHYAVFEVIFAVKTLGKEMLVELKKLTR